MKDPTYRLRRWWFLKEARVTELGYYFVANRLERKGDTEGAASFRRQGAAFYQGCFESRPPR
jgi:hypothetical protein